MQIKKEENGINSETIRDDQGNISNDKVEMKKSQNL